MADEEKKDHRPDRAVEIARIREGHKTTCFIAAGVVVVLALLIIGVCYVTVVKPPWLTLVLALIAPSGVIAGMVTMFLRYIRKSHARIAALEKQIDPNRASIRTSMRFIENQSPVKKEEEQ